MQKNMNLVQETCTNILLTSAQPIIFKSLTDEEFNKLMDMAALSYALGKCTGLEEFKKELNFNIKD